ncbi:hypothetical protein DFR50_101151 [Roseiarcus fermentans]|uniref:Uncharacterized protein n=2 Tax=Roseiarcus fermentans TaxID=1473586 RepID=A0A366FUD8_9HYPH|nr:hypothetical protein DFR50_101151 [Roseiarcus fermentans]
MAGVAALHANELGVGRVEPIARDLRRILRAAGAKFAFSRIEKKYLAATKVFDTYFDQGENLAVPWNVYWLKPMKLVMTFKLASFVITEEIAKTVWECLTAKSEFTSKKKFVEAASAMLERVHLLPDARSRVIVSGALQWAIENPENFTTHMKGKTHRQGHSPNFVAFNHIMDGLERFSKSWNRPIREIIHDEQEEFQRTLQEWHAIWSKPELKGVQPIIYPGDEPFSVSRGPGSVFRMSTENGSAGLQVIDVVLWLFRRALDGKEIGSDCAALLQFAFKRGLQNDFSFEGVGAFMDEKFGPVFSTPLTAEQQAKAEEKTAEFETHRQKQMQEYAERKTASLASKK